MAKATVTTLGNLIILALPFSLSASLAVGDDAAPPVNIATMKYPDPGYRFLGVYGGGDDRHFDYHLGKLSLGRYVSR
ncbi:MAG: hypothetical protein NT069_00555 [Planctomycetota bacterium]|nr:hypothetical protein [Planctomycetota bacterium]